MKIEISQETLDDLLEQYNDMVECNPESNLVKLEALTEAQVTDYVNTLIENDLDGLDHTMIT